MAPSAIEISAHEPYAGTIDVTESRHGDLYAVADIGAMRFDIAFDDARACGPEHGVACFSIDPRDITV
ncbi:hypothetical protein [Paraburkholderia piptadeniae]|nr:hypothetical protein [Paraburkholderia piptadeniae]